MLSYRVTVLGRFLQALEPERAARLQDQLRSYEASAGAASCPYLTGRGSLATSRY